MNRALISKLFDRIMPGSLGQILLLSVLGYVSSDTVQNSPLYRFLLLVGLVVNLVRFYFGFRVWINKDWRPNSLSVAVFSVLTLATSLSWGSISYLLLRNTGLSTETWLSFMMLSGVGSSAALSLAPFPRLAQAFMCCLLGPPFVELLLSPDHTQWSIAGVFALYFVFLQSHVIYQEELELEVYEKENQLQTMMSTAFHSIPGIVWTARPNGIPDFYNKQWFDYTGIEAKPDISCWQEAMHPDDFVSFSNAWDQARDAGAEYAGEFRIRRVSDQAYRLQVAQISPAKDDQGKVIRWFGTCMDIEDRKTAEQEKTRALVREKAAIESTRLKSEFLANMSHEVRTPLNAVLGMTELLLDSSLDAEQVNYLRLIRNSGESLLSIINDILDFSKIEAGKLELEQTNFDLAGIVAGQVDLLTARAEAKGLELRLEIDQQIPGVLVGDPVRVGQILLNLIGNAIKFTPQGVVEVKATYEGKDDGRVRILFSVRDEGVGIAPEKQSQLFQPFTQADSSTARHFGGTGLGLSICKKLVEIMNGRIGVESELGKGSKFWFVLRFEKPHKTVASPMVEEHSPLYGKIESCPFRTQKILVAEDNAINQILILATLKKLGFNADIASNGKEALTAINQLQYDLILMDCQMPEMDGFATTKNIRELEKVTGKHIPILALTANAMVQDQEKCLQSGMDDYITKPVKRKTLEMALHKWLNLA